MSKTLRNFIRSLFILLFVAAVVQVKDVLSQETANETVNETNAKELAFEIENRRLTTLEKEKQLEEYEKKIKDRESELALKVKDMEALRVAISAEINGQKQKKEEQVSKMVNVFETMTPKSSAAVLEVTDDWLAVEVLKKMDIKKMAKIMNTMNKDRSARLSEMMTGYAKQEANIQNHITSILKKNKENRLPAGQVPDKTIDKATDKTMTPSSSDVKKPEPLSLAPSAVKTADQGQVQKN